MKHIYVITWRDPGAFGLVQAYPTESQARQDLAILLEEHRGERVYAIEGVDLAPDPQPPFEELLINQGL